jgi:hypothetical protein
MSNQQILNIGVPVAIGFILILAIGYGKSLHDDINTNPKRDIISRVDLRGAREDFEEITNDLNIMTSQIKEGVENLKKIENSLRSKSSKTNVINEINHSGVEKRLRSRTLARGNKGKRNSKKKRK